MSNPIESHNFAEYFNYYISLVNKDDNVLKVLENTHLKTNELLDLITEDQGDYAYNEGKWTIKELLIHLIDTERIFCNRALRFARNDKTDLPGYDHDSYIPYSNAKDRTICDIQKEMDLVRASTIALFDSFSEEMLEREGTANGNKLTVLAIGYIIGGHEAHHINILKERYL
ncbi:MAG: DinB family protein [Vicingaceae bacterium]|nr:DinB family protein [Vicingaceae bacterium]